MASQQVTTNFPYYHLSVNGTAGILNEVLLTFQATDGGILGGLTQDDVAEALRDFFAGLPGYKSCQIAKYEAVQTSI